MAPHVIAIVCRLRNWANQIAARFGRPVYLVGSSLEREDARDLDIVIILPYDEYWGRYGIQYEWMRLNSAGDGIDGDWSEMAKRWAVDVGKLSAQAAKEGLGNVDMKIQNDVACIVHMGKPRVRLDSIDGLEEVPLYERAAT